MITFANGGLAVEQHQHPQEQHMHHRHYHHLHHLHPLAPSAALRIRMMTAEVLLVLVAAAAKEVLLVIGKITISIWKEEIICAAEEDRRI